MQFEYLFAESLISQTTTLEKFPSGITEISGKNNLKTKKLFKLKGEPYHFAFPFEIALVQIKFEED